MAKGEKFVAGSKTMLMRGNGAGRMPSDKGGDMRGKDTLSKPGRSRAPAPKKGKR
jgi:hypothetical protein